MTRKEFDKSFSMFKLSELIHGETSNNQIKKILKTFSCSRNTDLQDFLHNKALTFDNNLRSRTYIYTDNQTREVSAYFTISMHTLHTANISRELIKILDGYQDKTKYIPCFLIGQLGKSDSCADKKIGKYILEGSINTIDKLHYDIGGRFILLDAINIKKVISFYRDSLFSPIEENTSNESIKMIRPYFEKIQ